MVCKASRTCWRSDALLPSSSAWQPATAPLGSVQRRMARITGLQIALGDLLMNLAMWVLIILAIPLVATRYIDGVYLGVIGLLILASFEAVQPLAAAFQGLGHALAAAERVFAVTDAPPPVVESAAPQPVPASSNEFFQPKKGMVSVGAGAADWSGGTLASPSQPVGITISIAPRGTRATQASPPDPSAAPALATCWHHDSIAPRGTRATQASPPALATSWHHDSIAPRGTRATQASPPDPSAAPAPTTSSGCSNSSSGGYGLSFEHVHFAYRPGEREVLSDISFDLRPGSRLAIVGPSGAGKSTLVALVMRFWDPTSGAIRPERAGYPPLHAARPARPGRGRRPEYLYFQRYAARQPAAGEACSE